ncbi:MAG: phosphoribosylformimino-5-aminoimidazole carboxamide ribotide isomerase [Lachnospiraceae bacterium]
MRFRPCIDIHNGKVKQIVGGSLTDLGDYAHENFVAEYNAAWYAGYYEQAGLTGGHVILLNSKDSPNYESTKKEAYEALGAYRNGLMVGGGITPENACEFLDAGASHVIVTSYVFKDGIIHEDRIEEMIKTVGKERLVLDLSCRKKGGQYYVVTDRWQKFTNEKITDSLLTDLSACCDEFLVHAVDVEGKANGIEKELIPVLLNGSRVPMTYAGGIGCFDDLIELNALGQGRIDVTIGSALSIFGGKMDYKEVLDFFNKL